MIAKFCHPLSFVLLTTLRLSLSGEDPNFLNLIHANLRFGEKVYLMLRMRLKKKNRLPPMLVAVSLIFSYNGISSSKVFANLALGRTDMFPLTLSFHLVKSLPREPLPLLSDVLNLLKKLCPNLVTWLKGNFADGLPDTMLCWGLKRLVLALHLPKSLVFPLMFPFSLSSRNATGCHDYCIRWKVGNLRLLQLGDQKCRVIQKLSPAGWKLRPVLLLVPFAAVRESVLGAQAINNFWTKSWQDLRATISWCSYWGITRGGPC